MIKITDKNNFNKRNILNERGDELLVSINFSQLMTNALNNPLYHKKITGMDLDKYNKIKGFKYILQCTETNDKDFRKDILKIEEALVDNYGNIKSIDKSRGNINYLQEKIDKHEIDGIVFLLIWNDSDLTQRKIYGIYLLFLNKIILQRYIKLRLDGEYYDTSIVGDDIDIKSLVYNHCRSALLTREVISTLRIIPDIEKHMIKDINKDIDNPNLTESQLELLRSKNNKKI